MLCEKCNQKQATILVQKSINGNKTEMHLCQDCSSNEIDAGISIDTLFNGLLNSILTAAVEKHSHHKAHALYEPCPTCGMSYQQFKSTGRLGCENCYRVFSRELQAIIKNVQASHKHEGKYPQNFGHDMFIEKEAIRLRKLMDEAIRSENFEEAARLRDEIKGMESSSIQEEVL